MTSAALALLAITQTGDEIILSTAQGMAIRFNEADARPMGRNTSGVKGISLRKGDELVGMVVADPDATLLTACLNGYGKRTPFGPNAALGEVPTLPEDREPASAGGGAANESATANGAPEDEDEQQQQHHGLGQGGQIPDQGEQHRHHRRRDDRHPRCAPLREHAGESAGQQTVFGHAKGEPARHDHREQGAIRHGDEGDRAE